jgi:hypothetical protein
MRTGSSTWAGRAGAFLAAVVAVVLGLVVAVVAVALIVLDGNDVKDPLARLAADTLDRDVEIGGLEIDLGRRSRVRAEGLRIANADWSDRGDMVDIGLLDVTVDLWPLLGGRIVVPSLELRDASVLLERRADGTANWSFGQPGDPADGETGDEAGDEEPGALPVVESLIVTNSRLRYLDRAKGGDVDVALSSLESRFDAAADRLHLEGDGRYQNQPLTLKLTTAGPETLRRGDQPLPLDVALTAGDFRAKVDGTVGDPARLEALDLKVEVAGDGMADLWPLIGVPVPPSPPYRISGGVGRDGNRWRLENFAGRMGDSDLSGTIAAEVVGRDRPWLKADVRSDTLDLADLAGFIGAEPDRPGEAGSELAGGTDGRLLPSKSLDLAQLRAVDADVTWKAGRIVTPKVPIDTLQIALTLDDGTLRVKPVTFGIGRGRVEMFMSLYGARAPVEIDVEGHVRQVDLRELMRDSRFAQESAGLIGGRVQLSSTGTSVAEALAGADGELFLVMSEGRISHLLIELAGLDIAEALGIAISGDQPIPIRCLVADFAVRDGVAEARTLLIDTTDSNIVGEGTIDLGSEALALRVRTLPKDFSPLTLRQPIEVGGTLARPNVFPDPAGIGNETVAQKAINAVLTAVTGLLPPIDTAVGEDHQCGAVIERAKRAEN